MNFLLLCAWYAITDVTAPKISAQESAAFLMLAACILVFRTFRERHLLVWILGWAAYAASAWFAGDSTAFIPSPELQAVSQAAFILSVCLFAAGILVYTQTQKYILPLFIATGTITTLAVARLLYWPDEAALRVILEIAYRVVTMGAAVQLIRYRWGRVEVGPWLLSLSLLFLHLDWPGVTTGVSNGVFLMTDILLGLGMLFLVFDDSRVHTRQLGAVQALTNAIGKTQQPGPMMQAALEELKKLFQAKAAWFGAVDNDRVTIPNHIGVSPEFLKGAALIHLDESVQKASSDSKPAVVQASAMMPSVQAYLEDEGLHHLVLVPIHGKKAPLGTLALGKRTRVPIPPRSWTFFTPAPSRLGWRWRTCGCWSRFCVRSGSG